MFLFRAIETKRINLSLSRDISEKMNSNFCKKIYHEADKTEISNSKKKLFPNKIEAPKVFAESNNQSKLSGSCLPQSYLVLKETNCQQIEKKKILEKELRLLNNW